jgi:hypothetical protein
MSATEHNSPNLEKLWENYTGEGYGIPGYNIPRIEMNCAKNKKDKEYFEFLEKVWNGKQKYPSKKENLDKDGKQIPLKRPNFFDELFKSLDFGYSKTKETDLKEMYLRKGRPYSIEPNKIKVNKEKNKAKFYNHDRITYFESLVNECKKGEKIYPHMENIIEKAKEKIKNSPTKKNISETLKILYNNKGSLP